MTQPGGRSTGGNSHVVAAPSQSGRTAVDATATGGGIGVRAASDSGNAVSATTTGGVGVAAFSSTGIAVSATAQGTSAAIAAFNSSGGEALKVTGDTVSTTAAIAPVFISPLNNQPSGAHAVGHMYVTSGGVLKICTVAGTPGTWVSVGTQT